MFEMAEVESEWRAVIKIVGIGMKGAKAVGKMTRCVPDVEFFVAPDLTKIDCLSTHGEIRTLGSIAGKRVVGSDSACGRAIGDSVADFLQGTDLVFIVTGMESTAVSGVSANLARTARETGAFTIIIAADSSDQDTFVSHLSSQADSLLCLSINSLMPLEDDIPQILSEPALVDHLVRHAVGRIVQCVTERSFICLDFSDVKIILRDGDMTYMGIGIAYGSSKGMHAASRAVHGLSRQDLDIRKSTGLLVVVEGSTNMTMDEFEEAARVFSDMLPEATDVVFGCYFDDALGGNVKVTVFASFSHGRMVANASL
jgi:cell division protein FtsZ